MGALYEHVIQASPSQNVRHRRGHAERVDGPGAVGLVALQVLVAPLVPYEDITFFTEAYISLPPPPWGEE